MKPDADFFRATTKRSVPMLFVLFVGKTAHGTSEVLSRGSFRNIARRWAMQAEFAPHWALQIRIRSEILFGPTFVLTVRTTIGPLRMAPAEMVTMAILGCAPGVRCLWRTPKFHHIGHFGAWSYVTSAVFPATVRQTFCDAACLVRFPLGLICF